MKDPFDKPIKRPPHRPLKYPPHWTQSQKRAARTEERKRERELEEQRIRVECYKIDRAEKMEAAAKALDDLVPRRSGESKDFIDLSSVDVCSHISKILFANEMDYRKTVDMLRPKATPEDAFAFVVQLQNNENVQAALEKLFKSIGIDETSRNQFVKQIWTWFYGEDNEKALQASRILAKVFFADSAEKDTSETLRIEGLDEGLKKMLSAPTAPAAEDELIQTDAYVMLPGKSE